MKTIRENLSKEITGEYNLSRIISVDESYIDELIEKDDYGEEIILNNLGHSWTDLDDENLDQMFEMGNDYGVDVIFFIEGLTKGHKLIYTEENEEKLESVGSGLNCIDEAEVLVSNEKKFRITDLSDGRDDVGYVEIRLEEVK